MFLSELLNKTEKELKAIKKEDMIKCLIAYKWQYTNQEDSIKNLKKDLELSKKPYDQAKMMLIGATGFEVELDEYSKKPNLENVDLCFLIGVLLSKVDK